MDLGQSVDQMHVKGFRFDLASAMARDAAGTPMANPPVLWQIESDPVRAGTKLIAEACYVAGLYQRGSVPARVVHRRPVARMERQVPGRYPPVRTW